VILEVDKAGLLEAGEDRRRSLSLLGRGAVQEQREVN